MKKTASCIFALMLGMVLTAQAGVMVLNANDSLAAAGAWVNVPYSYVDDSLYTVGTGAANGSKNFRVGLADPSDTINQRITGVVIYAKCYLAGSKGKLQLVPFYDEVQGTASAPLGLSGTEITRSFDITVQRAQWLWEDINNLSVQFKPKTAKTYYANHIFAVVTSIDTTAAQASHRFAFDPVATPDTVGVAFPLGISALDSLGSLLTSYNGSVLISDQTGTISPFIASFTGGLAAASVTISDTLRNDFIVIDDGVANDTSGLFDVVNSGLHHFAVDPIGMQLKNVPFPISLSARDFFDDTVTSFTGKADLWDMTGTLTPDSTGAFAAGVWSGNVNIALGALKDSIACSYFNGKTISGLSNGFWVDDPLGVETGKLLEGLAGTVRINIFPNPLYRKAEFTVYSPKAGTARITVYNLLGQKAAQKDLGNINPGTVKLSWDLGSALPQGVYFADLQIDGKSASFKKLVILK